MTDPFAALTAAAAAAAAEGAALQAQTAALTAQVAADQATIAQLEAELEKRPPAPPTLTIRRGVNATSKKQHDAALPTYGPVDVWRYYQNPGEPIGWPTEYQLGPGESFVYSSKVLRPTVAQYVAMMQKAPTDRPLYVIPWHEYEDDIKDGHLTQADIDALYHTARLAQREVGPHVKIVCCLMGYTWIKGSGRDPDALLPDDDDFDIMTTDTYFAGSIGQSVSTIPHAFDPQIATAAKHGKPWGITETGVGQKASGQARVDAIGLLSRTIEEKLLSQPVTAPDLLLKLYFSTSPRGEWAPERTPGAAAAWTGVATAA